MAPDDRRSMLVQTTLALLLETGEMVTTRQIAEAAGVAEGTIFRVFADKDELLSAVMEAAYDPEPLEAALSAIDPGQPFDAQLGEAAAILQQRVVHIWRIMSSVGPRHNDRARRAAESVALRQLFERHRDELTVDPDRAAWLLRALTLSATHPNLVDEALEPEAVVDLFLHGVGREHPC
jgi:AcrR family transcriptional regulator